MINTSVYLDSSFSPWSRARPAVSSSLATVTNAWFCPSTGTWPMERRSGSFNVMALPITPFSESLQDQCLDCRSGWSKRLVTPLPSSPVP
jgi:hypothetical protein